MSQRRIVSCSVTSAGDAIARRLPFERHSSDITGTVAHLWDEVDGFVLVSATGIAVRAVAPHLRSKHSDPPVICVDDAGSFAIALAGGHGRGANRLARDVAALLGATPVVTTATDSAGIPALDLLNGFKCQGDVAGVTRAWLDGTPPRVRKDQGVARWMLPTELEALRGDGPATVTVSDGVREPGPNEVLLRPASLVLGVGASSGADPGGLSELVSRVLANTGLARESVAAVATIDLKLGEPAVVELAVSLGVELVGYPAEELAAVEVPNPNEAVRAAVGTPSVSEAAAVLAAGLDSRLVATKTVSTGKDSTVAIARRHAPTGHLAVVGLGPGEAAARTFEAVASVRGSDVIVGFGGYVDLIEDLVDANHEVHPSPIGDEEQRCRYALARASAGSRVALVCSGDPGVYAMASLVMELAGGYGHVPVTVVPGVTAALSAAGVLGAPLGHDHAAVSLSDLLTPWDVIERRLKAAADGDFVVSLYNPRSGRRRSQLPRALEIFAEARPPETPAAVVTEARRAGQTVVRTTLAELEPSDVGMLSLVVIGSTATRWVGQRMVTPRGYRSNP